MKKTIIAFIERIAKLISVKTGVTFALTALFYILAERGVIPPESVEKIFMIVIAFYFGTQSERKLKDGENNG